MPLLFLASLQSAGGLPEYVTVITTHYKPQANGFIAKASNSCKLCHAPAPPKSNNYGLALKTELDRLKTKKLTPAILQAVEKQDADGDGFDNLAEFIAEKDPSDKASAPPGPPPTASATPQTPESIPGAAPAEEGGPWSPQSWLYPRHAQHPLVVHFPIALFCVGLLFDILGFRNRKPELIAAGYYNLVIAAVSSPFATITGLLAWRFAYGGAPLEGWLLYHLILGFVTMTLLILLCLSRARAKGHIPDRMGRVYFALCGLALFAITITGHLGGVLMGQ